LAEGDGAPPAPILEIAPSDPGIDDLLMLTLSVDVPPDRLVNFPRLTDKLDGFAVVGQRALAPETEVETGESRRWMQQYRLEPETTGDLVIPALAITIQDPATLEAVEVETAETIVRVASIAPPDADLRHVKDILPPVRLEPMAGDALAWLIPLGLALGAFALSTVCLQRQRPSQDGPRAPSPPDVVALKALEQLRLEVSEDQPSVERFHLRLSAVVRRYLADAFSLAAPFKTTEELLDVAGSGKGLAARIRDELADPLFQCDRVKFARDHPPGEAMQTALQQAVAFVKRSRGASDDGRLSTDAG
jgi:hypothetical protein